MATIQTIMVVEDEPALLQSICFTLKRNRYNAKSCVDGKQAVDMLSKAKGTLDLVITDLQLPKLSGIELIDEIKKLTFHLPVLVMTAYGDSSVQNALGKRDIKEYLLKPFSAEQMITMIKKLLG